MQDEHTQMEEAEETVLTVHGGLVPPKPVEPTEFAEYVDITDVFGERVYDGYYVGRTQDLVIIWQADDRGEAGYVDRSGNLTDFFAEIEWILDPARQLDDTRSGVFGEWQMAGDAHQVALLLPCGDRAWFPKRGLKLLARTLRQMKPVALDRYGEGTEPPFRVAPRTT